MTRQEVADRIDALIKMARKNNVEVGAAVSVSKETVRQWREATIWPRMDKLELLARTLKTTPEFILLGIQAEKKGVDTLRERLCQNDREVDLLRSYRASNRAGKELIDEAAHSYQLSHPAPYNVVQLQKRRSKP